MNSTLTILLLIIVSCVAFTNKCTTESCNKVSTDLLSVTTRDSGLVVETAKSSRLAKDSKEIANFEHMPENFFSLDKDSSSPQPDKAFPIDSVSLSQFWNYFQENIQSSDKKAIISVLEFPVHAIYPILFQYAYDCDTLLYIKNEEKYGDFDIDRSNAEQYYDFIFSDVLKEVILKTSVQDLFDNGHRYSEGIAYVFFPKHYKVKVNCANDHNLKFYINHKPDGWQIGIGGL